MADTKIFAPLEEAAIGLDVLQNAKNDVEAGGVIDLNGPKKLVPEIGSHPHADDVSLHLSTLVD
jgi:hypothetical protein